MSLAFLEVSASLNLIHDQCVVVVVMLQIHVILFSLIFILCTGTGASGAHLPRVPFQQIERKVPQTGTVLRASASSAAKRNLLYPTLD